MSSEIGASEVTAEPGGDAGEGVKAGEVPEAPQTYEAATERLDQIIARLDSGNAELRETIELVREGKSLVEFCKAELDAVSGELEQLDLDALVEALEASG